MALLGLVAGVRGNAEALAAVLAAFDRRHVSRILCAGDVTGYNADPADCARVLRERRAVTVAGRSDLTVLRRLPAPQGPRAAAKALQYATRRTRRSLDAQTSTWLGSLPTLQVIDNAVLLTHGGLRDPALSLAGVEGLRETAEHLRYDFAGVKLCVYGSGPEDGEAAAWEVDGNVLHQAQRSATLHLNRERMHFIFPGAVDGQGTTPRKAGRRLARAALLDTLDWTVELVEVPYDAASTEAKAAVFGYRMTGFARLLASLGGYRGSGDRAA